MIKFECLAIANQWLEIRLLQRLIPFYSGNLELFAKALLCLNRFPLRCPMPGQSDSRDCGQPTLSSPFNIQSR